MSKIIFLTLLLVASALAEQPAEIPSPHQDAVVPVQPSQQSPPSVVVSGSGQPVVVGSQPPVEGVHASANEPHQHHHHHQHGSEVHHHVVGEQGVHPADQQPHHHHHPAQPASYYSPAGLIQVIGNEQPQSANKPVVGAVRNFEQYGQPESASIPANYKPFGSWGLYIGGNPADGYYTNYYKALSSSVDKQQPAGFVEPGQQQVKPVPSSGVVSQSAAFSPVLRQASSSPYVGSDYYPFAYSQSDLNTHHSYVQPANVASPQPYSSSALVPEYPYLSYADQYATKRLGGAYQQKEVQVPVQQQQQVQQVQQQVPAKGYQQRLAYASYSAAVPVSVQHQPAQQVVSYPVPVGSQIVGSQPGVDGAFNPYGIHAFTRYAVKPTVVNSDSSYYTYSYPSYKQHSTSTSATGVQYQPFSFYGYPLSQLHYSQNSVVPSVVSSSSQSAPGVVESPVHHVVSQPASPGPSGAPVDQAVGVVEPHHQYHHHQHVPVETAASDKVEATVTSDKTKKKSVN